VALAGRTPAEAAVPPPADLSWWREARFGMFVHWGPVSLRGTEIGWSRGKEVKAAEYDLLYRRFDPARFDARAWARLARDAGMGYLVLTTKHHDGFCLWPSELTDYDIAATPFGRDVVGELAAACRDEGMVFCAYHSICDHTRVPRQSAAHVPGHGPVRAT
jgi:alpha-L-fucosidase